MSPSRTRLAVALLLAAVALAAARDTYWRPFDDTAQESVASGYAYGFAAASVADLAPNPIVARFPNSSTGRVVPYPHWTNGFFLLLEGWLRIFGRTETAGRSLALLLNLAGFALVIAALGREDWLLYLTLPLLVVSAIGRDALPFVFNDAVLCCSIGALLFFGTRGHHAGSQGNFLSPSFGLATSRGSWRARASVYRSFRAPTLNELYREFRAGNAVTLANAALRP